MRLRSDSVQFEDIVRFVAVYVYKCQTCTKAVADGG
jgi:hypothetical protein